MLEARKFWLLRHRHYRISVTDIMKFWTDVKLQIDTLSSACIDRMLANKLEIRWPFLQNNMVHFRLPCFLTYPRKHFYLQRCDGVAYVHIIEQICWSGVKNRRVMMELVIFTIWINANHFAVWFTNKLHWVVVIIRKCKIIFLLWNIILKWCLKQLPMFWKSYKIYRQRRFQASLVLWQ